MGIGVVLEEAEPGGIELSLRDIDEAVAVKLGDDIVVKICEDE